MSNPSPNSDRHHHRAWWPSHPLRPSIGRRRRWTSIVLMLALWALIGGYLFLTEEHRVRKMACVYLADLLGAQVSIGGADLSFFDGLRLDNVQVRVPDGDGPQSTLLEAT